MNISVGSLVEIIKVNNQEFEYLVGTYATVELIDFDVRRPGRTLYAVSAFKKISSCGRRYGIPRDCLRPINPDSEPSTWDEVERITGFCPRVEA